MNFKFSKNSSFIPLLVPSMPSAQEIMPWLERMDASKHYSNFGPLVEELEIKFSEKFLVSSDQLTTVANATLGLELVLKALSLPKKSKVLIPAFTFVATATAVISAGFIPVVADVDSECWLLTPEIAYKALENNHIDAVLTVAAFGMPQDMSAWERFEKSTGLPVVVDAAAAYGSQWLQDAQGTLVFSLHATKSLSAGEGGLVVSTKPGLVERVRQLSNFGIVSKPGGSKPAGHLIEFGTNAKMSEYHAAVAIASIHTWEQKALERRALQKKLISMLDEVSSVPLIWQRPGSAGISVAPTLLCTLLPDENTRQVLEHVCFKAQIMTRRWYQPLISNMEDLRKHCLLLPTPNAIKLSCCLIGIPFFIGMDKEMQFRISEVFKLLGN